MTDVQKDQILRLASAGIPPSTPDAGFVADLEEQMKAIPERPLSPSQAAELLRLVDVYLPRWEEEEEWD